MALNILGRMWNVEYVSLKDDDDSVDFKTLTIKIDSKLPQVIKDDALFHAVIEIIFTELRCRTVNLTDKNETVYQAVHSEMAGQDMFSVFTTVFKDTIQRNKILLKMLKGGKK